MKLYKLCIVLFILSNMYLLCAEEHQNFTHLFENKNVLITGGTGFIGRALVYEILKHNPRKIVVFSRDEVKHYKLLDLFDNNEKIESVLGDVRDYHSILSACKGIDLVVHAAALKRIDMMEYHVAESIYTNALGTLNVARACVENEVQTALLISTDKACSPCNTYGACKFVSEKIFTNFGICNGETRFVVVRYGNVLESTGSIIPFVCQKIRNKEVIPLTDPLMTRFFITKEQAVNLICKALHYGVGGEVFVPNIPSFKIIDLMNALQDKLGVHTGIKVVGLRPGEKIHELMINSTEIPRTYRFKDVYIIKPTVEKKSSTASYEKDGEHLNPDELPEYGSYSFTLSREGMDLFLEAYDIETEKAPLRGMQEELFDERLDADFFGYYL